MSNFMFTGETIMELKDLAGKHMLDAVDFSNEQVNNWRGGFEDCQCMRFRLDGVVYIAIEDPSDGYRSAMRELITGDFRMANTFQPVAVIGRHRTTNNYGGTDDILELIDATTGKIVIEVGTSSADDYYPVYEAHFDPTAMRPND